jgi:hypothetical protein
MTEIWKDVVGYEEYFQVSNTGKIFSKRSNKLLKQQVNKKGYSVFASRIGGRDGKAICPRVHILVAKAFIDNPENKPTVNHVDGIKTNNNVNNLEWATSQEQIQHAVDCKLRIYDTGGNCYNAKLSDNDVRYIREHYIPGNRVYGGRALARKFNIHHRTIQSVINGWSYKEDISEGCPNGKEADC